MRKHDIYVLYIRQVVVQFRLTSNFKYFGLMTTFSHLPPSSTTISAANPLFKLLHFSKTVERIVSKRYYYRSYQSSFVPPTFYLNNFLLRKRRTVKMPRINTF